MAPLDVTEHCATATRGAIVGKESTPSHKDRIAENNIHQTARRRLVHCSWHVILFIFEEVGGKEMNSNKEESQIYWSRMPDNKLSMQSCIPTYTGL